MKISKQTPTNSNKNRKTRERERAQKKENTSKPIDVFGKKTERVTQDSRVQTTWTSHTGKLNGSADWTRHRFPSDLDFEWSRVVACTVRSGRDGCRRPCRSFSISTLCCSISMPSTRWASQLRSRPLAILIQHGHSKSNSWKLMALSGQKWPTSGYTRLPHSLIRQN